MKTIPVIIDDTVVQPKKLNIMFPEGNHDLQAFRTVKSPDTTDTGRFGFIVINTEQSNSDGNFEFQNNSRYAAIPVMFLQSLPESMVSLRPAASASISRNGSTVTSHQFMPANDKENEYPDEFNLQLSRREKQILDYVAQGYLNKQIADTLSISEQTIKNHVTSILRKLNASGRTQAVVNAIKLGLIDVPQTVQ
jgi:DNA-binding CsgD family transcriptional regulator